MNSQIQIIGLFVAPLTTLAVVVVGFRYNNSRITDLRGHLDSRINDLRDTLRAETKASTADLRAEIKASSVEILVAVQALDRRVAALEGERRIIR